MYWNSFQDLISVTTYIDTQKDATAEPSDKRARVGRVLARLFGTERTGRPVYRGASLGSL